jgi:uncharacterized membrane protein YfcA
MPEWIVLAAAGLAAGVINAIAGGGSLVSFPALLYTGMPSVTANATNTLAIWPGTVSSAWAYRGFLRDERRRAVVLTIPALLGGLAGSVVLLHTPERAFRAVVPWLIIFACTLMAVQAPLSRWLSRRSDAERQRVPASLWLTQLAISFYGGYFGAGIGILMLAAMGILLSSTLQHANALKVVFSMLTNGAAAIYFMAQGAALLPVAALMATSSLVGGYAGAHLAQRLPASVMRIVVILFGLAVAGDLLRH